MKYVSFFVLNFLFYRVIMKLLYNGRKFSAAVEFWIVVLACKSCRWRIKQRSPLLCCFKYRRRVGTSEGGVSFQFIRHRLRSSIWPTTVLQYKDVYLTNYYNTRSSIWPTISIQGRLFGQLLQHNCRLFGHLRCYNIRSSFWLPIII
jgi:hypothetical protein